MLFRDSQKKGTAAKADAVANRLHRRRRPLENPFTVFLLFNKPFTGVLIDDPCFAINWPGVVIPLIVPLAIFSHFVHHTIRWPSFNSDVPLGTQDVSEKATKKQRRLPPSPSTPYLSLLLFSEAVRLPCVALFAHAFLRRLPLSTSRFHPRFVSAPSRLAIACLFLRSLSLLPGISGFQRAHQDGRLRSASVRPLTRSVAIHTRRLVRIGPRRVYARLPIRAE